MVLLRKAVLFFVLCFSAVCNLYSQVITFQSTYDLKTIFSYASLTNVVTTSDGGYAFPVVVEGTVFDSVNIALIKTDQQGNLQWTKTLTRTSRLAMNSANVNAYLIQTSDGGYAVDMLVRGPTFTADPSLVVFRLDGTGNVIWETSFTENYRLAGDIMQANDGGIIVTGTIYSTLLDHDYFMAKLDPTGNCLWSKSYDMTAEDDFLNSADYTSDGGVILAGLTSPGNYLDMGIIKTDANGNIVWSYRYDSGLDDCPLDINQTSTGDYIITGRGGNAVFGYLWDIQGILIDGNGNVQWSYYYGGASWDEGYGVTEATDGGFVFACEPESFGFSECCLMKTDVVGNMEWVKRFESADGAFPGAVITAADGGYLMTGTYGLNAFGSYKLFLVKTDANGNTGCVADSVAFTRTPMQLTRVAVGVAGNSVFPVVSSHNWVSPVPLYTFLCPPEVIATIPENLSIPNVFSPDGDGVNDFFEITYSGTEAYKIEIYDRWGLLLFTSDNKTIHWSGRSTSGKEVVDGTYYYVLTIGEKPYTGFLTLLR